MKHQAIILGDGSPSLFFRTIYSNFFNFYCEDFARWYLLLYIQVKDIWVKLKIYPTFLIIQGFVPITR